MPARPTKISYTDDEVKVFHFHVEKQLKEYIKRNQLDKKYDYEHHPGGVTGTVPDFVIVEKSSGKWVFVIEVKRTPSSVRSIRFWDQARSYVRNNRSIHWSTTSKPFFLITNIELTYFLCDRGNAPTQFCLLKNGENMCTPFGNDATKTLKEFSSVVLPRIFELLATQQEGYSDNLRFILDDFVGLQNELSSYISQHVQKKSVKNNPKSFGFKDFNDYKDKMSEWKRLNDPRADAIDYQKIARDIARDSLLRIFTYEYCREYFRLIGVSSSLRPIQTTSKKILEKSMELSLKALERIDFSQVIRTRLIKFIPENMDNKTFKMFKTFLLRMHKDMSNALKENGAPSYLLNLIMQNEKFYPWKEANGDGKIMTDAELSDFISTLCFDTTTKKTCPNLFDPGCGTGNLLSSAYDRIKSNYPTLTHNQILAKLHGCEVDAFLGKLGVFGLIMRSAKEINKDTKIDIRLSDFFESSKSDLSKYDIVIMNPPYLRNDNKVSRLQRGIIEKKVSKIFGKRSFMTRASQPNFFFYFVELATNFLKVGGVGGYFIMKSVLNTQNGAHLKKFLLENFDINYLIACPRVFFQGYKVSPCIMIGTRRRKPKKGNVIKFAKIIDPNFFTTGYDELKEKTGAKTGGIRLQSIRQGKLKANDDWKKLLLPIPAYYSIFSSSKKFVRLSTAFKNVKRGELANQGDGSKFFFPWFNNDLQRKLGAEANKIEKRFRKLGLENSRVQKNYILSKNDLKQQQCLAIPQSVDVNRFSSLSSFMRKFNRHYERPNRWNIDGINSRAQLVIPRASRKIHCVLINPNWNSSDVYFSSNFVCLWNCKVSSKKLTVDQTLKFVAAFLNSSFGQIMFEIESQDREGLRKIEKAPISNKIFVPTTGLDSCAKEVKSIITIFEKLQYGLTGLEEIPTPRFELDLAIAKLLWKLEPQFRKFSDSPEKLAVDVQQDLSELVRDRLEI